MTRKEKQLLAGAITNLASVMIVLSVDLGVFVLIPFAFMVYCLSEFIKADSDQSGN